MALPQFNIGWVITLEFWTNAEYEGNLVWEPKGEKDDRVGLLRSKCLRLNAGNNNNNNNHLI